MRAGDQRDVLHARQRDISDEAPTARVLNQSRLLQIALRPMHPIRDSRLLPARQHLGSFLRAQRELVRHSIDNFADPRLAASGRCNSLELSGPRRFELAHRFSAVSLGRRLIAWMLPEWSRIAIAPVMTPVKRGIKPSASMRTDR